MSLKVWEVVCVIFEEMFDLSDLDNFFELNVFGEGDDLNFDEVGGD